MKSLESFKSTGFIIYGQWGWVMETNVGQHFCCRSHSKDDDSSLCSLVLLTIIIAIY